MNTIDEVMTYNEATQYLEKSAQYMYDMEKRGDLIEGKDYRAAGRVKLISKKKVREIWYSLHGYEKVESYL